MTKSSLMDRQIISDCSLTDTLLNGILLQIVPGKDEETLVDIDKLLGNDVPVYVGFGRHDLIILAERKEFHFLEKFHKSGLPHAMEWMPIVGLKWKTSKTRVGSFSGDSKVIGFSFVKIDSEQAAIQSDAATVETNLVKDISLLPVHVYSGLGINELLIITEASRFSELSKNLAAIKKELAKESPLVIDMSTIPAVNYRLWRDKKGLFKDNEKLPAYLLLSLEIGLSEDFKHKLDQLVESREPIYGFHDELVRIKGTAYHVIETIETIRSYGSSQGLNSTFTVLPHQADVSIASIKKDPEKRQINLAADAKSQNGIREANIAGSTRLDFYRRSYEVLKTDPMTKHLFRDNAFFKSAEELLEESEKMKSQGITRYALKRLRIDVLQESLRVGFDQRCAGIHPANLLCQRTARMEPYGGIQRIILATEALPVFLLNKLGFGSWRGFCIYGYSSRFYTTQCGIINIPEKYRTVPEKWFSLFHEVGHEVFNYFDKDREMKTKIMREVHKILNIMTGATKEQFEEESLKEQIINLIEEIFAELFGFHYGFRDNWNLYVNSFWPYFYDEYGLDTEHLSRSIIAYLAFGPGNHLTKDQIDTKVIDKCTRDIERAVKRKIDQAEVDRAIMIVFAFLDVADLFRHYISKKPKLKSGGNIQAIQEHLRRGRIVKHDNPVEIFYAFLTDKKEHSCCQRFALIMSLYNTYCNLAFQNQKVSS